MSNPVPGEYLKDRDEYTSDAPPDGAHLLVDDPAESLDEDRTKRWPFSRLRAWASALIATAVGAATYRFALTWESNNDGGRTDWGYNLGNGWNNVNGGVVLPFAARVVAISGSFDTLTTGSDVGVFKNPSGSTPETATGLEHTEDLGSNTGTHMFHSDLGTPVDLVAGDLVHVGMRAGGANSGTITLWLEASA